MTSRTRVVIGGVDTHADTHEAAVLDSRGRLLAVKKFLTTDQGIRDMLTWMRGFGRIQQVGVEGTGSYGAELTRQLQSAGIKVIEVNQPHAHTRSRRGKTDAIDAEAAARKVLAGQCTAIPKDTTGIVEAVRQLHVARAGAVQARTAALNQLDDLLVTAPGELRQKLTAKTLQGKASQCAQWQPDHDRLTEPVQAAQNAMRSIATRIGNLSDEIRTLERHLSALVKRVAPRTLTLVGVGPVHAAQMLVTAGGEHRAPHQRNRLRAPVRRRPDPRVIRQDRTPPPQPRRQPRRQPQPLHDRRRTASLLRTHPRLQHPPHR
jgi:transposase